jgi:hypothetical protein
MNIQVKDQFFACPVAKVCINSTTQGEHSVLDLTTCTGFCWYGNMQIHIGPVPVTPVSECASAAVKGVLRGHHDVTVPFYYSVFLLYRVFAPEVLMWAFRLVYVLNPKKPPSKKILEATEANKILYPASIQKSD